MNKLKKLLALLLVCTTLTCLTACGNKNVEGELSDIMEKVYEKMYADVSEEERPMLGTVNVLEKTEDMTDEDLKSQIEYAIGTYDIEYDEIYESKPMIGSIAYSVVLVRMKDGADIEAAKTKIKEKVDPRKWICASVPEEDVIVKSKGDLIILIMVENETLREKIEEGFDNL